MTTAIPKPSMKIQVTMDIPEERVSDLLCCAFEGGSTYWASKIEVEGHRYYGADYGHEVPMAGGRVIVFQDPEEDGNLVPCPIILDKAACLVALQKMASAQEATRHWGDFVSENDDAWTGDYFLQLAVLGEVVYG